jgi:geranylgeranyl pyrophosphate synthase
MGILNSIGAVEYVSAKAEAYNQKAKAEVRKFSPSASRARLLELLDYMVERDR